MKVIWPAKNSALLVNVLMRNKIVPSGIKDVSPDIVNLFRSRYIKLTLAILLDMVKPAIDME